MSVRARKTILVCEDEQFLADAYATKLGQAFTVLLAYDGQEALNILNDTPVDLVIADIMMPNVDGIEMIASMKKSENLRHIPIVAATNIGSADTQKKLADLGVNAYFIKADVSINAIAATCTTLLSATHAASFPMSTGKK